MVYLSVVLPQPMANREEATRYPHLGERRFEVCLTETDTDRLQRKRLRLIVDRSKIHEEGRAKQVRQNRDRLAVSSANHR